MKTTALLNGLAALLVAPLSSVAQLYLLDVIGPFNSTYTYGTALNNSGRVLGHSGGEISDIFLSSGVIDTFPGNMGGLFPREQGTNDAGDIVGQYLPNGNYHAHVSSGGVVTDRGAIGGAHFSGATCINNAGQIVGQTLTDTATTRAFLYASGVMSALGTLGGTDSWAKALKDPGLFVGLSLTETTVHTFIFNGQTMTDLNSLVDLTGTILQYLTSANDLNASGQITGDAV